MGLRYPNGKKYIPATNKRNQKGKQKNISYSNRGMTLEEDINETNKYYLHHNIAVIHKKPTPIQIVHVDYPSRSSAVIKEAYFKQPSTTDYNGVFKGRYIDFEAKETRNHSSFPLKNFHPHQLQHMKQVSDQGGISFVILRFAHTEEVFLLESKYLFHWWERMQSGGRKSITKEEIEDYGYPVTIGFHPRLDYIKIIHELYEFH